MFINGFEMKCLFTLYYTFPFRQKTLSDFCINSLFLHMFNKYL